MFNSAGDRIDFTNDLLCHVRNMKETIRIDLSFPNVSVVDVHHAHSIDGNARSSEAVHLKRYVRQVYWFYARRALHLDEIPGGVEGRAGSRRFNSPARPNARPWTSTRSPASA